MKIGIMGRGRVAQALRSALGAAHSVRLGVRSPEADGEGLMAEVAAWAEVIVLATPWSAAEGVSSAIRDHVEGKPVIDATNPVGMRDGQLDLVTDGVGSAAEALQAMLPAAHVVKTFNQIGAEGMADANRFRDRPVMFAAGDDEGAKSIAMALAQDAGFTACDGGPLSYARHLESLAMLWIWTASTGPNGRDFGFTLTQAKN